MGAFRNAFKAWKSRRNADGFIFLLGRSADPQATLQAYQRYIDDDAIEALNTYSYYAAKTKGIQEGLKWVEIAHQASLIGGNAESLAECFIMRALILERFHEEKKSDTSIDQTATGVNPPLTDALESALKALQIYQEIEHTEKTAHTLGTISTLYQDMDRLFLAFEYRLITTLSWIELPDVAEAMPHLTAMLVDLYWDLEGNELQQGSSLLLEHVDALVQAVTQWIDEKQHGDLFDMLGSACSEVDRQEEAFLYWKQAISHYQRIQSQPDEFRIWGHMQDYAAQVRQEEKSIEYGEACINTAPNDTRPSILANRYQKLAMIRGAIHQKAEAIADLHRAADLYNEDHEEQHGAGPCLLHAASIEDELGMIDRAQEDLERVLTLPGGVHTYWFAEKTLAEVLWKRRGDLGAAIKHADDAVQLSISSEMSLTIRAASLHISGYLYALTGDNQKALNRSQAVLNILIKDHLKVPAITIHLSPLFDRHIPPPPKAEAALVAFIAAKRAGLVEDAQRYLEQHRAFAAEEPVSLLQLADEDEQELLREERDLHQFLQGCQLLVKGEQLMYTDPTQAIAVFEEALPLFAGQERALTAAISNLGLAMVLAGDMQGARACLEQALQFHLPASDTHIEVHCRSLLGAIEASAGNLQAAYEQLSSAIRIMESQRVSLPEVDQRMLFLPLQFAPYAIFIGVCTHLRHFEQALETVESIKSRAFSDLLAQTERRPLDHLSLNKLQKLETEREQWIQDYHLDTTSSSDILQRIERRGQRLDTSIHIDRQVSALREQLQNRQRFLQLEPQLVIHDFAEIRALLTS